MQSSSVTVPNTADLFGEEDTDGAPAMNNGSGASTPRASLLQSESSKAKTVNLGSPAPHSTLQPAGPPPPRPANTYENTPVSPALLPVDAASVSLSVHFASNV